MNPLAKLSHHERSGVAVVGVAGEVDASNAVELRERIFDAVSNQVLGVVLDLRATTYLDSAAVQLIFELGRRLRRRQLGLRVVCEPETFVDEVLDAVNVEAAAGRAQDVEAAVSELADPSRALPRDRG